ncbi:MAG: pyrroline-5-carboxylate reductase dimerization domain-containing protein [Saprospiraceae bacterium]
MVQNLLNTTGKTIYVETERAIDATTAISGSGPAYVFYFMESMMKAARTLGFSESEAELLVSQTFRGTVDLFQKSDFSCTEWIQKVASKGGTTEAALKTWESNQMEPAIMDGHWLLWPGLRSWGGRNEGRNEGRKD